MRNSNVRKLWRGGHTVVHIARVRHSNCMGTGALPCVAQGLFNYGKLFADAGMASVILDYANFGGSEGSLRYA